MIYLRNLTEDDERAVRSLEKQSNFVVISKLLDSPDFVWGLFDENRLIGFCAIGSADAEPCLRKYPDWTQDALLLCDVFIDEEYRGRGLGSYMVSMAIRRQDCSDPVFCVIEDENLRKFYKALGFTYIQDGVMVNNQYGFFPIEHKCGAEMMRPAAQACPQCGALPYLRDIVCFDKPIIISCDCGFYQAADTRTKAINLWNKAGETTLNTKLKRVDKHPTRRILHTIAIPNSVCQYCQYRKEYYKKVPTICNECGHLEQRSAPYQTELWVYEDV